MTVDERVVFFIPIYEIIKKKLIYSDETQLLVSSLCFIVRFDVPISSKNFRPQYFILGTYLFSHVHVC